MKVHQLFTHNQLRNFTYVIELNDKTALIIDPWDADEIKQYLTSTELGLTAIINTHEHWDHTQGNNELVDEYQCEVWAHKNGQDKIPGLTRTLTADELIELEQNIQLEVLDTPGHTFAHLCFMIKRNGIPQAIFTGDTLFNAGVGHCRGGGDEEVLFQTIQQHFQNLNDHIVVYPGHDYLGNNLKFTLKFEPNNQVAKTWLDRVESEDYIPGSIQTTIGDEKSFNTFLRLDNVEIIKNLSLEKSDPKQVFLALRSLRDHW